MEQRWSKTQKRQFEEELQVVTSESGAMQGRSENRNRAVAHRRGGRQVRLAWVGIQEHDVFLGHEMRAPAGTGRGGVSWLVGGKARAQGRGMG